MHDAIILGAGPAGLACAKTLVDAGAKPVVLEAHPTLVGGISRTETRTDARGTWRFDIGGHRFFTKSAAVDAWWRSVLPESEWLDVPRSSRILFGGSWYDYPLRPLQALARMGPVASGAAIGSWMWAQVVPPRDQSTFDGFMRARFGDVLYRRFFESYTEKVWGMKCSEIGADWAAQRIKGFSLWRAAVEALPWTTRSRTQIATFRYPRLGPGHLWEHVASAVGVAGGDIVHGAKVEAILGRDGDWTVRTADGRTWSAPRIVSSVDLPTTLRMVGRVDLAVNAALRHRDFLIVACACRGEAFKDQWVYLQDPGVRASRVQNFRRWSPHMVPDGWDGTCYGVEYHASPGDDVWDLDDRALHALACRDLATSGIAEASRIEGSWVVRQPKAYPIYDAGHAVRAAAARDALRKVHPTIHQIGRNGQHRYDNQDHAVMTGLVAADVILGKADPDAPWRVNDDGEYHETGTVGGDAAAG